MSHILASIMQGEIQCWTILMGDTPVALITTTVVPDAVSGSKNLLVYSLFATRGLTDKMIIESTNDLMIYKNQRGCKQLVAYSANEPLVRRLMGHGWKAEYVYMTKE